jgi:hypothetical protein
LLAGDGDLHGGGGGGNLQRLVDVDAVAQVGPVAVHLGGVQAAHKRQDLGAEHLARHQHRVARRIRRDEVRGHDLLAVLHSLLHLVRQENFPQICIGVGERNWGPTEAWLPISKAWIPGHPGLAGHITRSVLNAGFDPAFSH